MPDMNTLESFVGVIVTHCPMLVITKPAGMIYVFVPFPQETDDVDDALPSNTKYGVGPEAVSILQNKTTPATATRLAAIRSFIFTLIPF